MVPEDLSQDSLISALENANLVYFDGRLPETALVVAEEVLFVSYSIHNKCSSRRSLFGWALDGFQYFPFAIFA